MDIWWRFWSTNDSEYGEAKFLNLELLIQGDGDFSRWQIRRDGINLAAGHVYGDENTEHFDAAQDACTKTAHAIIEADELNTWEAEERKRPFTAENAMASLKPGCKRAPVTEMLGHTSKSATISRYKGA